MSLLEIGYERPPFQVFSERNGHNRTFFKTERIKGYSTLEDIKRIVMRKADKSIHIRHFVMDKSLSESYHKDRNGIVLTLDELEEIVYELKSLIKE